MTHPEVGSGAAGDTSIYDELRCARLCEALEKAPASDVLAMAKTLARAAMVTHPAAMRLMIREAIRAQSGYSPAETEAIREAALAGSTESSPEKRPR